MTTLACCRVCGDPFPRPATRYSGHPAYCNQQCREVAKESQRFRKALYDRQRNARKIAAKRLAQGVLPPEASP